MKNQILIASGSAAMMLASPAVVLAQTEIDYDELLNFYGNIHLGMNYHGGDVGDPENSNGDGAYLSSNFSHFGLKGETAVDDRITAMYQVELGFQMNSLDEFDDDFGDLFDGTRDTYVGLDGPFGTVKAGQLPVANRFLYDANLFGEGSVGDVGVFTSGGLPARENSVVYTPPLALEGVRVDAQILPHQNDEADAEQDHGAGLHARYDGEGYHIAATHYEMEDVDGADNVSALFAGLNYGLGEVVAGYVIPDEDDRDRATLGASYDVPTGRLKAQTAWADDDGDSDNDGLLYALGYDHIFTDQLTGYATLAIAENGDDTNEWTTWGYGHNLHGDDRGQPDVPDDNTADTDLAEGDTASSAGLGLRYTF
ncbi:MAG: porin [Halorhodospira sp.]